MRIILVAVVVLALMLGQWAEYDLLLPVKVVQEKLIKTYWVKKVADYDIDWDFISKQEGGQKLNGYHPTMKSGVTVATGIDLKQKNRAYFENLGVSKETIDKLEPFFGLTGQQAKQKAGQLKISKSMADELDQKIKVPYAREVAATYEKFSGGKKFTDLSRRKQTVLVSVGFQHGSGFYRADKKTRMDFIQQAGRDEWDAVYKNLMNFGDNFGSRRKREANYLMKDLQSGKQKTFMESSMAGNDKESMRDAMQAAFADQQSQDAFMDVMSNSNLDQRDKFLKDIYGDLNLEELGGPWNRVTSSIGATTKFGIVEAQAEAIISEDRRFEEPDVRYGIKYRNGGFSAEMFRQGEKDTIKASFRKKF